MGHKILITGGNGQLAQALAQVFTDNNHEFLAPGSDVLDITNYQSMLNYLNQHPVDFWINAAAYTDVNRAETEQERAYKVNSLALRMIADICRDLNIFLIHISTDYVFDGNSKCPYSENASPNPLNNYGLSKLLGEFNILNSQIPALILRSSWIYSNRGKNFFLTMTKLLSNSRQIKVVNDQIGSPTYAPDLAQAILQLIQSPQLLSISRAEIINFANQGQCSWYDFTVQIQQRLNFFDSELLAISSKEFPSPAKRPLFSVLDCSKIRQRFGIIPRYWQAALEDACFDFSRIYL